MRGPFDAPRFSAGELNPPSHNLLIGVFPTWPHSSSWGYGPSGVLGMVVVIIVVLLLMGRL